MQSTKDLAKKFKEADHQYQLAYGAYMTGGDYATLVKARNQRSQAFKTYTKAKKAAMNF